MQPASALKRAALAIVLLLAPAAGAEAGRFCGDPVESGVSSGATQEEALSQAEQWWSSRAGTFGRGYESWENARDRSMECSQDQQGTFHCKATGRPCLPAGVLPDNIPKMDL